MQLHVDSEGSFFAEFLEQHHAYDADEEAIGFPSSGDTFSCLNTMWNGGYLHTFHDDVMQLVDPSLILAAKDDPLHPQYVGQKTQDSASLLTSPLCPSFLTSPTPPLSPSLSLGENSLENSLEFSDELFPANQLLPEPAIPVVPSPPSTPSLAESEEEEGGILIAEEPIYHPRQDHCYLARPKPIEIQLAEIVVDNARYVPIPVTELAPVVGYDDVLDEYGVDISEPNLDVDFFEQTDDDDDDDDDELDSDSYSDTEEEYKSPKSESVPLVRPEETVDVWTVKNNSRCLESPVKRKGRNTYTPRQTKKAVVYEESYPRRGRIPKKNIRLAPTSYEVEKALKSTRGRTRKTKFPTKKNDKGNKRIDHNELEKERRSQQRDLLHKLHKVIPNDYFKLEDSRTKCHSKQHILQAARKCVENCQSENRTLKDIKRQHAEEHRKLFSEYLRLRKSVVKLMNWKA